MERLVGQTLSRYRIVDLLGEGGMGAVFRATDLTLQRDVAIKIMHPHMANQPNFRERFLQEARTAARLDHSGIVQVYDFGQEQSLLFIGMEFIRGANLRQMLEDLKAEGKWIPLNEAVQIIRQIALAMDYAHRQGVLHRDLKPSNVMIEPERSEGLPYRPVLTDLGLARLMEGQRITRAGTSMGTPTYMSPEQAMGEDTDARSDVYSLGVMLYELAVGRPPFPIKTLSEAIRYHTKETPPSPRSIRPDLPAELEEVILRAMAKDREARWHDAAALAGALSGQSQATTAIDSAPTAMATAVSLMTQYQKSISTPRGPSVLKEFATPSGSGDTIQARLADGETVETEFEGTKMTVGRADDNDITLDSQNVSRYHARIEGGSGTYRVVDLGSTNGTYIGSAKLLPGVPEDWPPDKPLRIGDAWLRLSLSGARASSSPLGNGPARDVSPGRTHVDRSMVRTSTGEGRVGVVMEDTQLTVAPGQRAVTSVILLNQGPLVDHFSVAVEGIPADWVTLPPVVQLMPGEQQEVTLTLHPPRSSESKAGRYTVTVRVLSRDHPSQFVDVRLALTVGTFSQFTSSLQPQKVRAGRPMQVTVRNEGNFPDTFTISGSDRGNELTFEPPTAQVKVAQGETATAELQADPIKRRFIGGAKSHPFVLKVAPSQGEARQHAGELVSRGVIPAWVPPLLIGLFLIICIAAALLLTRAPVIELAEVEPTTPLAGQPVTIRWRVRNARRVELRPFGVELEPDTGEYTFEQGFTDNTAISLVAFGLVRSTQETLTIGVAAGEADPPVVNEWSVFPTEITQGQQVTIRWSVSNADSVRVQPFGTVDGSGERTDAPQQTETYTLLATNQDKNVEQSQRVVVVTPSPDAPEITTFAAAPSTLVQGVDSTVQLSWETERAETVTIEPGLGPVGLTGTRDVPIPASDTVYTLVAQGPGGELSAQVQVVVEPQRCFVTLEGLNLREGPGIAYDPPMTNLAVGTQVTPIAFSMTGFPDGQWVKVQVEGTVEEGWVAQPYLGDCNVDVTGLGTAAFPPTPTPPFAVTNLQATANPNNWSGACPVDVVISVDVTANGPGTVNYYWYESAGVSRGASTLDFAGPGTQTVEDTRTFSSSASGWQTLNVTSPEEMSSNQAAYTVNCLSKAAYINRSNATLAQQYVALLEDNDFEVDTIAMNAILSTDFGDYALVLIGPDTGTGGSWGDNAGNQAQRIRDANVPVLGLGEGGYAFFGKLGFEIGWGNGWHGSGRDIYVMDDEHPMWNRPNEISIPGSSLVRLYSSNSDYVAISYPSSVSGVTGIGRQSNDNTHYQIMDKNTLYVLWGFDAGPQAMTDAGRQVFVNAARSAMRPRFFILPLPVTLEAPFEILP